MKLSFDANIFFSLEQEKSSKLSEYEHYELSFAALDPCENDSGDPDINLRIELKTDGEDFVSIYLEDPNQIDALRRYCEMVLDHHYKNIERIK